MHEQMDEWMGGWISSELGVQLSVKAVGLALSTTEKERKKAEEEGRREKARPINSRPGGHARTQERTRRKVRCTGPNARGLGGGSQRLGVRVPGRLA